MALTFSVMRGVKRPSDHMARRPRGHEKILMEEKRLGYFPERFTWRSRQYRVCSVDRCWTVSRRRLGSRVDRMYFRVRCASRGLAERKGQAVRQGTFDVYQDLNTNTWHLEKVVSVVK